MRPALILAILVGALAAPAPQLAEESSTTPRTSASTSTPPAQPEETTVAGTSAAETTAAETSAQESDVPAPVSTTTIPASSPSPSPSSTVPTTASSSSPASSSPASSAPASSSPSSAPPDSPTATAANQTTVQSSPTTTTTTRLPPSSYEVPAPSSAVEIVTAAPDPKGIENGATIYFPSSTVYWVFTAAAVVQWAPPIRVPVDILLVNEDAALLPEPYRLSTNVPGSFMSMTVSVAEPAAPGKGYYLLLADSVNHTVYAQSQLFELRPQGVEPIMPGGYAAQTAEHGAQGRPSAASRARWTWCAAVAAVAAWVL